MRLGIAEKITLTVVAIILAMGVALGLYFTRREARSMTRAQAEYAQLMTSTLASNLQYPVLVRDHAAMERLVSAVLTQPDVVLCRVADNTGNILHEARNGGGDGVREFMAAITVERPPEGAAELLLGGANAGANPVEVVATVVVQLSQRSLHDQIANAAQGTAMVLLAVLLSASIISYVLLRVFLGAPVAMLAEATRRIARGELEVVVPISRDDEIGALADAFNAMTAELQSSLVSRDYVDKIVDSMADAVLVVDEQDRITRVNAAAGNLLGYRASELLQQPLSRLFASGCSPHDARRRLTRRYGNAEEEIMLSKSGERIPVMFSSAAMSDADGGLEAVVCVAMDERERKKAEQEIRKLSTAVEQSTEGIALADLEGNLTYVNNAFALMHGQHPSQMIGLSMEHLHPADANRFAPAFEIARTSGAWSGEMPSVTADGAVFPTYLSATVLRDESGASTAVLVHVSDMTHQKELESQLLQAQKLESIGQLAGGIAHDFNNMLGAISGYADMIRQRFAADNPMLQKYAERILDAARRSADLTTKLLAFARKATAEQAPVDVHAVVRDAIALLEHTIDRRIRIVQHLDAQCATVLGDRSQLQNAVLNLAVNARDAMEGGGEMTFTSAVVGADMVPWHGHSPARQQRRYVRLTVTDTGTGMDEHTLSRIFEPFFTTKQLGKGTGLGLASVYGTVQSHKGILDVHSELGKGTRFDMFLPCFDAPTQFDGPRGEGARIESGRETVLVVDDEELVREMARDMLTHMGYEVVLCTNGAEAVEYFQTHHDNIDLVILDMIMPRMGGLQCYTALRKINPELRALISSGYALNDDVRMMLREGAKGFIQKPFEMQSLAKNVREALQR
jgi:two-component system, cell cycle sensor histidine kinase and response regulator CckA